MRSFIPFILLLLVSSSCFGQLLPPKQAYPFDIKQIHSGHSLTDPLFANWPGQYVNLIAHQNALQGWALFDVMVGKSTTPGSSMKARWETPPGFGSPDARHQINNWALLCITERVPLAYQGGNTQQWYLDQIQEQKEYLSHFVNNAWTNGNNGNGAPTLLWTTWTSINDSNGPWRQMLNIQGAEFERMQEYANLNKSANAPHVYLIPGHKMMARLYDDIQLNKVPGITHISQLFLDQIHTNSLGNYAIAMIHYACIFNKSPVGLPNQLIQNPPADFQVPSPALAAYLQNMVWEVVTSCPRTGISQTTSDFEQDADSNTIDVFPNPASDVIYISSKATKAIDQIYIYNSTGALVHLGTETAINLGHLPSGLYLIKTRTGSVRFVKI